MKSFYEMMMILEYGYDAWKTATPPGWDREGIDGESLNWDEWREDSKPVYVVRGGFVDGRGSRLAWLDDHVGEVLGSGSEDHAEVPRYPSDHEPRHLAGVSDFGRAIWLTFEVRFGSSTDRRGESADVAVEVRRPALEVGTAGKVDLPEGVCGGIKSHFFGNLESF